MAFEAFFNFKSNCPGFRALEPYSGDTDREKSWMQPRIHSCSNTSKVVS